jgi:rhamnogalacturonyl hydrolase YesR
MFAFTAVVLGVFMQGTWTSANGVIQASCAGTGPALHRVGDAPGERFSLSFRVRITGGKNWHSVGAYFGKGAGDSYQFGYISADSPETKAQIGIRRDGQEEYPSQWKTSGDYKVGKTYRIELRVAPPLVNLLVDGKLRAVGDAVALRRAQGDGAAAHGDGEAAHDDGEAARGGEVGLMAFDVEAEFSDVKLRALRANEHLNTRAALAPKLTDCATKPARSWAAYFDLAARFAGSDVGIDGARRDPVMGKVPPYVFHAVIEPGNKLDYDGAYPAFHHSLFMRAFLNCYRYYGDEKWLARAKQLADWNIARSTPPDCAYPNLPYSTVWEGKMGGFMDRGGIMLDKVGWTGLMYLRLYGTTGDAKYLKAARNIGDTLLKVQNKDGSWYFRVRLDGGKPIQDYTGNQVFNVQFLEKLTSVTGEKRYLGSAAKAWKWLEDNPLRTDHWEAFYEDVDLTQGSIGNWDAIEAGRYLAAKGEIAGAKRIADWVRGNYGVVNNGRGIAIMEQTAYMVPMNCHTMHWCQLLADLYRATRRPEYRKAVISSVNMCTANVMADGRSQTDVFYTGPDGCWYSLSFSPLYLGLELLADFPDQAPANENHILGSTGDVRNVTYAASGLSYETAGPATETIKLVRKPKKVDGGEWRWDGRKNVVTVTHSAGAVKITY